MSRNINDEINRLTNWDIDYANPNFRGYSNRESQNIECETRDCIQRETGSCAFCFRNALRIGHKRDRDYYQRVGRSLI